MYKILVNGSFFSSTLYGETMLIDPTITLEENRAGTFTFTIPPTHPFYDLIETERSTIVEVYENDDIEPLFDGFVDSIKVDMFRQKMVTCEGVLSFLNDSILGQKRYSGVTVLQLLTDYINRHNAQVDDFKNFSIGSVTVTDPNDYISCYTNNQTTMTEIKEDLVDDLGGILRIRKSEGTHYIDYLATSPRTNNQTIAIGENLMDLAVKSASDDICTAVIPLGATLENQVVEGLDKRLDITSVTSGGVPYVYDEDAVAEYGWIYKVIVWDDVTTPTALKRKAEEYLATYKTANLTIEATAFDLGLSSKTLHSFRLSDQVRVLSVAHGLDRYFRLTKLTRHLNSPESDTITLGDTFGTSLSSKTAANTKYTETASDNILTEAKANATQILHSATGGVITIKYNADGVAEELLIMDTADIETATKVWRFNINGLGYSDDGYDGTYDLAMTMDGSIVADFIKSGTLEAERIGAGFISSATSSVQIPISWASSQDSSASRDTNGYSYSITGVSINSNPTMATAYRKVLIGDGEMSFQTYAMLSDTTPLTTIKFDGRAINVDGTEVLSLTSTKVTVGTNLTAKGNVEISGNVVINGAISGVGVIHASNIESSGYGHFYGDVSVGHNAIVNSSYAYKFSKFENNTRTEYTALADGLQTGSFSDGTAPTYHSLHLGADYNCITSDKTHYFSADIHLDTSHGILFRASDGAFRTLIVPSNESGTDIIRIGAGACANEIYVGTVENTNEIALRSKELRFSVSNYSRSDNWRPYYRATDSFSLTVYTSGYVSSGGNNVYFNVPLDRPVMADYCMITSVGGLTLRQNGNYTHGSSASSGAYPTSYSVSINPAGLQITAVMPSNVNAENNAPIGVYASIKVEFYNGGVL